MIKDIEPDSNFEMLRLRVLSKNGPRMIGSIRKKRFITELLVIDREGTTCTMTLWNKKEGESVRVGKIIEVYNGWCKIYNGQKQLSLGKSGVLVPLGEDDPAIPRSFSEDN